MLPAWSRLCAACRYLFNAGEGFQRYCVEHRHRLVRMKQVLATQASHTALGGLPGTLLLYIQRACQGPGTRHCTGKMGRSAARLGYTCVSLVVTAGCDGQTQSNAALCCLLVSAKGGLPPALVTAENRSLRMTVWHACAQLLQPTPVPQTRHHAGWERSTAVQAVSAAQP